MEIEEFDESAGGDRLFGVDFDDETEAQNKPVTINNVGKKQFNFKKEKPESIEPTTPTPRRRGRPAKSTAKNTTQAEAWVVVTCEILLGLSTGMLAASMNDVKYKMTKTEAESAAKGLVYVLFQFKQVREFAALVNPNSNYAVLAKAFWPYISRVFMKELVDNVVSGFFISNPRQRKSGTRKSEPTRQSNGESDGTINPGNDERPRNIAVGGIIDWRDVG